MARYCVFDLHGAAPMLSDTGELSVRDISAGSPQEAAFVSVRGREYCGVLVDVPLGEWRMSGEMDSLSMWRSEGIVVCVVGPLA